MDTLTGDALALIRRLDVGPVHWVGLSMGGLVGLRLAARHGALLRSLTLLDAEPNSRVSNSLTVGSGANLEPGPDVNRRQPR